MDAARNLRGNQTGRTRTKIEVGNSRTQGHPLVLDIKLYSPLSEAAKFQNSCQKEHEARMGWGASRTPQESSKRTANGQSRDESRATFP
eukprot:3418544-Rhodomonas_salina.1